MQPTLNPTYTFFKSNLVVFKSNLVVPMILGIVAQAHLMAQSAGTFIPTGNMTTARANHTATLLLDGRVLIAGGLNYPSVPFPSFSPSALATAEVYDPATGTYTATGSMTTARSGHTATLLPDGRVLIAGGSTTSAELYNPSTETFSATGEMVNALQRGSATLLTNGKVLITGGIAGSSIARPELYDPSTGMFSLAGPYASIYQNDDGFSSTATLLPNGKVLFTADALYAQYGGELYDSTTNTFSLSGVMVSNIVGRTAALLINGKVLLAGGSDGGGRYEKAEQYDPVTGKFTAAGDMTTPRNAHAAVLLPDGTALITGGEGWGPGADGRCCQFLGSLASAEIYDSFAGTFTRTGNMTARREYQQATLLNDGRVLVTGGLSFAGIDLFNGSISSSELYNPPVLTPAPALFSLSGNGKGQGAIWHGDTGQLASASSPAVAGEVLSLYTTSLVHGGVVPPQVAVGGWLGTVLYFGDAPGYPGYYQVNFRLPTVVPAGPAVTVRLSYLNRPSNEVTIGMR